MQRRLGNASAGEPRNATRSLMTDPRELSEAVGIWQANRCERRLRPPAQLIYCSITTSRGSSNRSEAANMTAYNCEDALSPCSSSCSSDRCRAVFSLLLSADQRLFII
eukprot:6196170-Pleurochrysis_carterae.AAC.4